MKKVEIKKQLQRSAIAVGGVAISSGVSAFGLNQMSIQQILDAQQSGALTCVQIVSMSASARKAHQDLNAFISENEHLLEQAQDLDRRREAGEFLPLHCVPFAVKDNIDVAGLPTTGGSTLLLENFPARDATVVEKLRKNGALVVGKTNLDELAIAGSTVSSLGGQTLNPHDKTRFAAGSSGGSAVAVATGMATCALGTETVNSLRNAASSAGVVAMRTTHGLVSRDGSISLSPSMDVVGPMCKTVEDVAAVLGVITGRDARDPETVGVESLNTPISLDALKPDSLKGKRLGLLSNLFGTAPEHQEVNQVIHVALQKLRDAGVEIVDIPDKEFDSESASSALNVSNYEFRPQFEAYLATRPSPKMVGSVAEYEAAKKYPTSTMKGFMDNALAWSNPTAMPKYIAALRSADKLKEKIANLISEERLDALVYPAQKRPPITLEEKPRPERNGIFASALGLPTIDLTAGFTPPSGTAPHGLPIGVDFLGKMYGDLELLRLANAVEKALAIRSTVD